MAARSSYTRIAIWFHWLIAALIIGQLIGGKVMMALDPAPLKFELFQLHKSFGFMILLLSLVRLIWRLLHRPPALPQSLKRYERIGAKLSHWGFYGLMIATPLAGWALVSASTTRITTKLFKLIAVPDMPGIPRSIKAQEFLAQMHEYLAYAIIALLALHIGAALKHQFIDKDDIAARMIPRLGRK